MPDNPGEGSQTETVSKTEYIGVKTMLQKREESLAEAEKERDSLKDQLSTAQSRQTELETDVKNLGEKVEAAKKSAVDPEDLKKAKEELATTQASLLQTKRGIVITTYGVTEDDVKDMGEKELETYAKGLAKAKGLSPAKPGADLGAGGGGTDLSDKKPLELARIAYTK